MESNHRLHRSSAATGADDDTEAIPWEATGTRAKIAYDFVETRVLTRVELTCLGLVW